MSANLILHWMLDTLEQGNTISDETSNHLNGTVIGNPQTVPEEKFGSCLCFDGNGDSITILDNATLRLHNYTAEVWIKPEQTNNWQGVLGKPGRNYNIWLGASGYVHHRFNAGDNSNAGIPNTEDGSIVWGQWHHVAITNDGQTARTYINGILKAEGAVDGNLSIGNTPLIVGRGLDDTQSAYYKGCMAHLRLYDNVLTLEEIRRDMLQDESAASAFVRSHPIDFELYNEDNYHVLFIDNHPEGQTLWLDILNSSPQNIQLNDIGQIATPQAHHLELRFRPETLAPANLAKIKVATDGWSLDRAPDGTALYLLHQGSTTLEAGKTTSLQLTGMNADGRGGTRGTRVDLVYQNMHYAGEENLLDGSRLQYLNIVNHQGRRNMPLHVGFVGSDTVLSDGTTHNTLRLRIANLSRDFGLPLSKGDPTTSPSRFRISFDVQGANETSEWALTDYTKVDGVSLHVIQTPDVSPNWADPEKRNLGQTVEWTVAPSEDTTLGADGYIILELRNLVALTSIGHANIYINFENIPGYEDEQVVIVVQKSPLLFSNSNVGIGTNSPGAKLQIIHANQDANGNTLILGPTNQSNLRLGYHQDYSWIQSHEGKPLAINPVGNNVGIGIADPGSYKLNVEGGNTRLGGSLHFSSNQEIFFADNGQIRSLNNNHQILFRCNENKMELREYGDLIFSPGATKGEETVKMVILSNGNVGIGIADPGSYKLNVKGGDTCLGGALTLDGALTVGGEIRAGNSALYFTKTDHSHTGIGNEEGYAAIENAANYNALMILGRAGKDKNRRVVRLWDYLEVNGSMDITGTLAIGQTVIGERELQILKALTSGMLEVELCNIKQGGFLHATDYYDPLDPMQRSNDRVRKVFTWRRKEPISQSEGRWRLTFPGYIRE